MNDKLLCKIFGHKRPIKSHGFLALGFCERCGVYVHYNAKTGKWYESW